MSQTATRHGRHRPTEQQREQRRAAERELMARSIEALRSSEGPLTEFGEQIGSPVAIQSVPGAASGYYEPATRRIVIDEIGKDFSPNAQVATLIHELAHALVRCDRSEEDPKLSYAEEEIVVESAAYTVCGAVGLDTSGFSLPYLTGWSERAHGAKAIERYAALIDRLAGRLENAALGAGVPNEPIAA